MQWIYIARNISTIVAAVGVRLLSRFELGILNYRDGWWFNKITTQRQEKQNDNLYVIIIFESSDYNLLENNKRCWNQHVEDDIRTENKYNRLILRQHEKGIY